MLPNLMSDLAKRTGGVGAASGSKFAPAPYKNINSAPATQSAPGSSAPTNTAPTDPNGSGSGTARVDRSNDIAIQLAGLGAVDTQLGTGLSAIDKALAKLLGNYDTETNTNEGIYKTQSETNQNNLQKNKQTALVNAAQGRQGLFGTLASLGALSGSGIDLANRAVQKGANDDLSGAADTFGENQTVLDTAIGQYRQDDKMRRENANTAAENARLNARSEAAKTRMTLFTNLANNYAEMGDAAEAKRYTDMAAALYPEMARTTIPNANISYTGAAFSPGALQNYIAGADSTAVSTTAPTPGGSLPGLIATPSKRRQQQPVAAA